MVGEHLPVVLAALLDVDDDDLLQPEGELPQHVALHQPAQLAVGPAGPEVPEVEPVVRLVVEVQPQRPEDAVVDQEPALFAEPGDVFPLGDALRLGEGGEQVLHRRGAQAREEDDAEEDEVAVVLADTVAARIRVVVG